MSFKLKTGVLALLLLVAEPGQALVCANAGTPSPTSAADNGDGNSIACGHASSTVAGSSSLALGYIAVAKGLSSIAIGGGVTADGAASIAIGNAAYTLQTAGTAIGYYANAKAYGGTALGLGASSDENAVAVGRYSEAGELNAVSIGNDSEALGLSSLALGDSASALTNGSIAIGQDAIASGIFGMGIGRNSSAQSNYSAAYGLFSSTLGEFSTALGYAAKTYGDNSTALGWRAQAVQDNTVVLGSIAGVNGATVNADVGVGLTAPLAPLHIYRDDATQNFLVLDSNEAGGPQDRAMMQLVNNGGIRFQFDNVALGTAWRFQAATGNRDRFEIAKVGTNQIELALDATGNLVIAGTLLELSDRGAKQALTRLEPTRVLERLSGLAVHEWSYRDSPGSRHIGPMAQDFHAAFGLGPDDQHLAARDLAGVNTVAIQALVVANRGLASRIQGLEAMLWLVTALSVALVGIVGWLVSSRADP